MKYTLYCLFAFLFLYACNSAEKKSENLYDDVMDVHDDAMKIMGDAMRLQKGLDQNIQKLMAADSSANKLPRIEYLQELKTNLKSSDEAMMDWMRQFDNEMDGMEPEQRIEYLLDQKKKIESVNDQLNTAIKNAEEAIK